MKSYVGQKHEWVCDLCGRGVPFNDGILPHGWYRIDRSEWKRSEEQQVCSAQCLRVWADSELD